MADSARVSTTRHERVAVITIAHPPANALNAEVLRQLDAQVRAAHEDSTAKVLVITGAGERFFVAGADINELADITDAGAGTELSRRGQGVFDRIANGHKPAIAAVNGMALGGGCELAMACHLRIASETAQFGQPEIKLGAIPGYGGTQRLPRLIGATHAMEWNLTGRMASAQEAAAVGLVNRVVPADALMDAALELAHSIAGMGGRAVAGILDAVRAAGDTPLAAGLQHEADVFGAVCATADFREGVSAFLEKRPARFSDH